MKQKLKKFLILAIVAINLFTLSAPSVQATSLSGISGSVIAKVVNYILGRFDIDEEAVKYSAKNFNVSRFKEQPPQVSLEFSPENPTPGQRVTAIATPLYFLNSDKDLYFTWYLKPAGCPEKDTTAKKDDKCNFDGKDGVTIEDYKVKAARIIANNEFEWDKDGDGEADSDVYSTNFDDKDSYKAIWGGDDQKNKNDYCFIHDTTKGEDYPITCDKHLFPLPDETGDGEFGKDEEEFWHTDPQDPDTADTGNGDEANITGLGVKTFTWNYERGDEVGVVVEGISVEPTQKYDSSYKIMWAILNNRCFLGDVNTSYPIVHSPDVESTPTVDTCPANLDEKIQRNVITEKTEFIVSDDDGHEQRAGDLATVRTQTTVTTYIDANCNGINEDDEKFGDAVKTSTCPDGVDSDVSLDGYFCLDGHDEVKTLDNLTLSKIEKVSDINKCLYNNFYSPSEGGRRAEKMNIRLSANPKFPINDPTVDSDEGDMIHVSSTIVNPENNGFLKYNWQVYASDTPNPESWGEPLLKKSLLESSPTSGLGLDSFQFRLNLYEKPTDKPGYIGNRVSNINNFYLKVKLTVSEVVPEGISDKEINSGVTREGYASVVVPVSSTKKKIKVLDTQILETGKNVELAAGEKEKCDEGLEKKVCPVIKNDIISLQVDKTDLTDFQWTLDGKIIKPLSPECSTPDCNNSEIEFTNFAFFPVLDNPGKKYNVSLTATAADNNDDGNQSLQKITLSRLFEVVEPSVKIMSMDESVCRPILLGYYVDNDDNYWPDRSQTKFNAEVGAAVQLKPVFTGLSYTPIYNWYVDGNLITRENAALYGYHIDENNILSLPGKDLDEAYRVAVSSRHSSGRLTQKALYTYWQVPYNSFYEKNISSEIKIDFTTGIGDAGGTNAQLDNQRIFASVLSSMPEYLAFLFRIVLTSFIMLIVSSLILSLFPNIKEN